MTAILVSGCQTKALDGLTASLSGLTGPKIERRDLHIVASDGAPIAPGAGGNEIDTALQGLAARLMGHSAEDTADKLNVDSPKAAPDGGPGLAELVPSAAIIHRNEPVGGSPGGRHVAGTLMFWDDVGRHADILFDMRINGGGKSLRIDSYDAVPLWDDRPGVSAFVVPTKRLEGLGQRALTNYRSLHRAVRKQAVALTGPSSADTGAGEYALIAFLKGRTEPGTEVQIKLARSPKDLDGDATRSYYRLYEDGWLVAVVRTELDLSSAPNRWIKVIRFGPERKTDAEGRVIGLFSLRPGKAQLGLHFAPQQ